MRLNNSSNSDTRVRHSHIDGRCINVTFSNRAGFIEMFSDAIDRVHDLNIRFSIQFSHWVVCFRRILDGVVCTRVNMQIERRLRMRDVRGVEGELDKFFV